MRIGLFGGTFDPLHIGHLMIAEAVRSDFPLDQVMFIPAAISPHKVGNDLSPPEVRLEMVRCAIKHDDGFEVSDVEIQNKNISYTVDTVRWFRTAEKWCDEFESNNRRWLKSTIADWKDDEPQLSYEDVDTSLVPPRPRLYGLVGAEIIEEVWKKRAAAADDAGNGRKAGATTAAPAAT